MNAAVHRYRLTDPYSLPNVRHLLKLWNPDGCIVECGTAPRAIDSREFGKTPTVFLDRHPSTIGNKSICIYSDPEPIAETAAKELLALDLDVFAYISWHDPQIWSEERGARFARIVENHGKVCHSFRPPPPQQTGQQEPRLERFLASLPKRCGVFTANDIVARRVISVCGRLGLAVPDDLALVSVDNDEDICEHLPTTVTSIEPDFAAAGRMAAEQLNGLMSGKGRSVRNLEFGVKRIVRRASANGLRTADRRVAAALEFIRVRAANGITPADVIAAMGCSTSLANLRFREAQRKTILEEIHARRLEIAKELLLAGSNSIETVAGLCGYASATDFSRVFRRHIGCAPLRWQKTARESLGPKNRSYLPTNPISSEMQQAAGSPR